MVRLPPIFSIRRDEMFEGTSLFGIICKGGVAMLFLAFCSILILAIIIERMWSFRKIDLDIEEVLYKIQNILFLV